MNPKVLQIVEAVARLYQTYGVKSVTMDDVAAHLGISKKTLYEHFHNKKELLQAVLRHEHEAYCSTMSDIRSRKLNAIEELFEIYKLIANRYKVYNPSMFYDVRKYYPGLFMQSRDIRRQRMYEAAYSNMEQGKAEGLYRSDLNSGIIARLHVFRTETLFDNDMFTKEELTSFAMFHEVFVYHLRGMLSQAGHNFFDVNFEKFKTTL